LRAAGFLDIQWHRPLLLPEGEAAYGRDYWSDLLDHPPLFSSSVSVVFVKFSNFGPGDWVMAVVELVCQSRP